VTTNPNQQKMSQNTTNPNQLKMSLKSERSWYKNATNPNQPNMSQNKKLVGPLVVESETDDLKISDPTRSTQTS
jgi:hypothetical protein